MITDLLKFNIKEGSIDDAIDLMRRQMQKTLGDEGCLIAKAFHSRINTNEIYMLLGWESREAIDKHLKTDHDQMFRVNLDPLLSGPPEFYDWETIE